MDKVESKIAIGRRVFLGLGSNALVKCLIFVVQIGSVPVLIFKWGVTDYGLWVMLVTIPSYIVLGDLGFGMAASADMTRKIAMGDRAGAIRTFQSIWVFVTVLSLSFLAIGVGIWWLGAITPLLDRVSASRELAPIGCLMVYSVLALQMNLMLSWYQSTQRYPLGALILGLMVPAEGAALLVAVWLGADIAEGAAVWLVVRALGLAIQLLALKLKEPWIAYGWKYATVAEIHRLSTPALAALSMPISTALNIQGAVVIVGIAISPAAAAMFGTVRTITRIPLQLIGTLSRAAMPEIAVAQARGETSTLRKLVAANLLAVGLVTVPSALVTALFGERILALMSHGRIHAPLTLLVVMTVVMAAQTLWNTLGSFLFALNLQHRFTHLYALIAIVSTALCYPIARRFGIIPMSFVLLLVDTFMVWVTFRAWRFATGERWTDMVHSTYELSNLILQRLSLHLSNL